MACQRPFPVVMQGVLLYYVFHEATTSTPINQNMLGFDRKFNKVTKEVPDTSKISLNKSVKTTAIPSNLT